MKILKNLYNDLINFIYWKYQSLPLVPIIASMMIITKILMLFMIFIVLQSLSPSISLVHLSF